MKYSIILALVATASAVKIDGDFFYARQVGRTGTNG